MLSMGESALIIYNVRKFYDMIDQSIKEAGYEFSRHYVTYYDPKNHDGDLTLHHKNEEYQYQNEYRILIAPTNEEGVKIPVQELQEISVVIDSETIEKLRLTPEYELAL